MAEEINPRKLAKDAHEHAGQAADSSRRHSGDLKKMAHTAQDAREMLTVSRARQRKREKSKLGKA